MIESWTKIIDPNFINAELIGAEGAEKVVTITDIDFAECYDEQTKKKVQKESIFFQECKPLVLNKTNAKTLKKIFSPNSDDPKDCIGHQVILKVEKVKAFGKVVDAIRIKEYSETKCEGCGNVILPGAGKSVAELVEISKRNCGKALCIACMKKEKERSESNG
jgi:hypothetical protein